MSRLPALPWLFAIDGGTWRTASRIFIRAENANPLGYIPVIPPGLPE